MSLHLRILSIFAAILLGCTLANATLYEVTMTDGAFTPRYLRVDVGDTVRWHNQSGENRYLTTYQGEFSSGIVANGASWTRRMTNAGSFNYVDLYVSSMQGTVDAGTSTDPVWSELAVPAFNFGMQDVVFTDTLHGFLASGLGVYRTTNGGESWTLVHVTEGAFSMQFLNNNLGWCCGDDGYIHRTTDGGASWETMYIAGEFIRDIHFSDSTNGWACGWEGLKPRTTDGGVTWSPSSHGHSVYFTSVEFMDSQTGWMCGNRGRIWKTTDGGLNWNEQLNQTAIDIVFNSIDMWDSELGCAAGLDGMLYRTTDGGANWTEVESGTTVDLFKVLMVTATQVWLTGDNGFISRSDDGGVTWTQIPTPCFSRISGVYFTEPGNGYFTTYVGRTFRYQDSTDAPPPPIMPATVSPPPDGNWFPIENPQNYPNPFNPTTNIAFDLNQSSHVKLEVFDMLGRSVAVLANGILSQGHHTATFDANNKPSGMYFYQLSSGDFKVTHKMILQK